MPNRVIQLVKERGIFRDGGCAGREQRRLKPSFMIIGTWKAATTSLAQALVGHPDILPASRKELYFFTLLNDLGVPWYWQQFPCGSKQQQTFEGTVGYLYMCKTVPKMIQQQLPPMKFLVVLRNPVERTYSHFRMEMGKKLRFNNESVDILFDMMVNKEIGLFKKCLETTSLTDCYETYPTLSRGLYYHSLRSWFKVFPQENFKIVDFQQLIKKSDMTLQEIFHFLGLKDHKVRFPHIYSSFFL
jgi:hypothetical protein